MVVLCVGCGSKRTSNVNAVEVQVSHLPDDRRSLSDAELNWTRGWEIGVKEDLGGSSVTCPSETRARSAPTSRLRRLAFVVSRRCASSDQRARRNLLYVSLVPASLLLISTPLRPGDGSIRTSYIDERLSAASHSIDRRVQEVRCWSRRTWWRIEDEIGAAQGDTAPIAALGFVWPFQPGVIHVSAQECAAISSRPSMSDRSVASDAAVVRLALGLRLLGHEIAHMASLTESFASCHEAIYARELATSLGVNAPPLREKLRLLARNTAYGCS